MANQNRYFSLNLYLRDINQIPLLDKKEETELGRRIRSGDESAIPELVEANLRWAYDIAKNFFINSSLDPMILVSYANDGLYDAAKTFDPDIARFTTYSTRSIYQSVVKGIAREEYPVNIPPVVHKAIYRRSAHHHFDASTLPDKYQFVVRDGRLEKLLGIKEYGSIRNPEEIFTIEEGEITGNIEYEEKIHILADVMKDYLNDRDREIILDRFGFHGKIKTLNEIGDMYGKCGEWARIEENKILHKIRKGLVERLKDDTDNKLKQKIIEEAIKKREINKRKRNKEREIDKRKNRKKRNVDA